MAQSYGANLVSMQTGLYEFQPVPSASAPTAFRAVMKVSAGTFTANSGTPVTVADANVTATSQIDITLKTAGGTPAAPWLTSITVGTGFTVNSGGSDTSVYNYTITG